MCLVGSGKRCITYDTQAVVYKALYSAVKLYCKLDTSRTGSHARLLAYLL